MKRFGIILAGVLLFAVLGWAQKGEDTGGADAWVTAGSQLTTISVGSGFYSGVDVTLGYEFVPFAFPLGDGVPFALGFAFKPNLWIPGMWAGHSAYYLSLDFSATFHVSWKAIFPEIEWLSGFHNYIGLGGAPYLLLGQNLLVLNGGFVGYFGLSYFFTENVALFLEGGWYAYRGAGKFGVTFQFR